MLSNNREQTSTDIKEIDLSQQFAQLKMEYEKAEEEFGKQRTLFKDLFMQKELELQESRTALSVESQRVVELSTELNNLKSAAALSANMHQDELDEQQHKHQEEVASWQQMVKESADDARNTANQDYNVERDKWQKERAALLDELHAIRQRSQQDESILGVVAKSFRKVTADLGEKVVSASEVAGTPTLQLWKEAEKEPVQLAPSIDESSEASLEESMRKAQADVSMLKGIIMPYEDEISSLKAKVNNVTAELNALRNCASQVEQKCECEELRCLLKVEHSNAEMAQANWQRSMEKLISCQNCFLTEVRRVESLLNEEQRQQLADMRLDGTTNECAAAAEEEESSPSHERRIRELLELSSMTWREDSFSSLNEFKSPKLMQKSWSGSQLHDMETHSLFDFKCGDAASGETLPLHKMSSLSLQAKLVISEKEWTKMQLELKSALHKLAQPCQMCKNYETQLQNLQKMEESLKKKLDTQSAKIDELHLIKDRLEDQLKSICMDANRRLDELTSNLKMANDRVSELELQALSYHESTEKQLEQLLMDREKIQVELSTLQSDNETLCDLHTKTAQNLREESLQLPTQRDEVEILFLKLREDLISARSAKEFLETSLLKQLQAERDQRSRLEEQMQFDSRQCAEAAETKFVTLRDKSRVVVAQLHERLSDTKLALEKSQQECAELSQRIGALQAELRNSESVQQDFCKLNQTLQVELEACRGQATQVRWQEEEDVAACNKCEQDFSFSRHKFNCRHCGRIFCADCSSKSIPSGPSQRPARICDFCHTLLDRSALPYFGVDVPNQSINNQII